MAFFLSRLKREKKHDGITAIAIDTDKNSHHAVKWAVEDLVKSNNPECILVHVHCKATSSEDSEAATKESLKLGQRELQHIFLPYRGFCARKGVETKEVILHDIDVSSALIDYIISNSIGRIVLGASSRNAFTRRFRNGDVPSTLLKSAPEFCMVYVISKGKIQTSRTQPQTPTRIATTPKKPQTPGTAVSPRQPQTPTSNATSPRKPQTPGTAVSPRQPRTPTGNAATSMQFQMLTIFTATPTLSRLPTSNSSTPMKQNHHKPTLYLPLNDLKFEDMPRSSVFSPGSWKTDSSDRVSFDGGSEFLQITPSYESEHNCETLSLVSSMNDRSLDMLNRGSLSGSSEFSGPRSLQSTEMSDTLELSFASGSSTSSTSSQNPCEVDAEIRRLRLELKQSMELYNSVCKEADVAKLMAKENHQLHTLEARKLEEAKLAEEAALSMAEMEKQRANAATEAAEMAQKLVEIEAKMRKHAEIRAKHEAEERHKALEELAKRTFIYRKYTIEEIEVATDHFASYNKIGEGGYGPVYKAVIDHTAVAIKMLRPDLSQGPKQFRKEVEVLSSMRHPNMVLLLGACPEYGCLVYEYMEKGSLEDRLFRKGNTSPIPWQTRFKIACEIATGLLFLHETKPEPVVHRDLKPANILLDSNYVSKISDVGLARLVPPAAADSATQYHMTEAAGTFCYIDPEYQQTGMLGVKSDLYSLGVVLLQLITAKNPMGLSYQVEEAIKNGTFADILDPTLTDWRIEEALSLAKVALKCCELRKKDRPDLGLVVLPELNRLRDLALDDKTDDHQKILPPPCPCNEAQMHLTKAGMRNPNVEMANST